MKLELRQADGRSRINLDGIIEPGTHFQATANDDGTITLAPVDIVTTRTKRGSSGALPEDEPFPGV